MNDIYCDDCVHLHPNERMQELIGDKRPHMCTALNKRVLHGAGPHGPGHHPHILRHSDCPLDKEKCKA